MKTTIRRAAIVIVSLAAFSVTAFAQPDDPGSEAIRLLREVVQANRDTYGPEHPKTLESTRQLARVLAAQHQPDEAAAILRDAVAICQERWGANHPETTELKTALAHLLLMASGDLAKRAPLAEPIDPRALERRVRRPADAAIQHGIAWLLRHQAKDGRWDADAKGDGAASFPDGGNALNDIGVTGLSVLAMLGAPDSLPGEGIRAALDRGLHFLAERQDDQGLIGGRLGQQYMYNHGIASLALCEALRAGHLDLRPVCQRAVNFILKSRNPYSGWRYESPPSGDNDTSVTGWMLRALASAQAADLQVDKAAFEGGLAWIEQATDPETGRTGYNSRGGVSAREANAMSQYPPEAVEAMTAVGLTCRLLLGQDRDNPMVFKGSKLLLASLPKWNEDGGTCDMTYWYYGTLASRKLGGDHWGRWSRALFGAALSSQRSGNEDVAGSWDPVGPWGKTGGRVYSTATMVLSLEQARDAARR